MSMSQTMADLFKRITSGVYVIGVAAGDRHNAFTAAWVMPVSFDPLLLALSINPHHSSYELLRQGGSFSVNVLSREQLEMARHFGGPASTDKLASVTWRKGRGAAPLLADALAWFECDVVGECPAGDHALALGHVRNGILLRPDAEPLTYRDTGDMDGASAIFPDRFS
jgi:flavin reductase (DIM6/NTAB) family NADH-FMN oxidoreductase RutF